LAFICRFLWKQTWQTLVVSTPRFDNLVNKVAYAACPRHDTKPTQMRKPGMYCNRLCMPAASQAAVFTTYYYYLYLPQRLKQLHALRRFLLLSCMAYTA